jgi:hypothetical protein
MPKEFSPDCKVSKMLNRLIVDEGQMKEDDLVEASF